MGADRRLAPQHSWDVLRGTGWQFQPETGPLIFKKSRRLYRRRQGEVLLGISFDLLSRGQND